MLWITICHMRISRMSGRCSVVPTNIGRCCVRCNVWSINVWSSGMVYSRSGTVGSE